MRVLPEFKAHALVQLKTMLEKESAMALHMRKFGMNWMLYNKYIVHVLCTYVHL